MKLIVFSDSHGQSFGMRQAAKLHPNADCFLHLGDGNREFESLCAELNLPHAAVRGNCDLFGLSSDLPMKQCLDFGGCRVFLCHGHEYAVKYTDTDLIRAGVQCSADLIMFGHTHIPCEKYLADEGDHGIYLFNPGSISTTHTYGIVEIVPGRDRSGILTSIAGIG